MNMFEEIDKIKAELPKAKNITGQISKYPFNAYQIFAIFTFFIFFCTGIILGNLFPACGSSSTLYSGICVETEFNVFLMICVWFVGLLIGMFIFGLGHIIALLESINKKLHK